MTAHRFDCPTCGPAIGVDEDGCCRMCGAVAVALPKLCSCRLKINHLRGWRLVGTDLFCTVCDGQMRPDQTGERPRAITAAAEGQ